MDFKDKIQLIVTDLAKNLSDEFGAFEKSLTEKKSEYQDAVREYTELISNMSLVKSEAAKEEAQNAKERKNLDAYAKEIDDKETEVSKMSESLDHKVLITKTEVSNLEVKIKELNNDIKIAEIIAKQKDVLTKDVAKLNETASTLSSKIKEMEGQIDALVQNKADAEREFNKVNADKEKDISDRLSKVIERERLVEEKAKANSTKEADLVTIEQRWKKIYEEKGAGFKI